MKKLVALAATAAAGWLSAGAAMASDVYWSVGISAPAVGAVVSNTPHRHYGPPVYYGPPAVVYHTAPVYVAPQPIYYAPAPVIVSPGYGHGWRHRGKGHGARHDHGRGGRDHHHRRHH